MTNKMIRDIALKLTFLIICTVGPIGIGHAYQMPSPAPAERPAPSPVPTSIAASPSPAPAPLTSQQLDTLVAPIALYPDALVAQVLGAAAFPEQIAYASDWLAQNTNLTGTSLAQAVDQQQWDPSVKALTQFSSVLNNLAKNLAWTTNLGEAFSNQQAAVMAAVQSMRAQAMAAGTLKSTPQIQVVQQTPQTIVIQPMNPEVIYVPQYDPTIVYGVQYVIPYYRPPFVWAVTGVTFGTGVNIGVGFGGGWGGFGWGFHSWNCNWAGGGGTIIYNHTTYIHNTTYINNRTNYNGYHPWANNTGYHPGADTHYGPNGGYHPNGYFGPNGSFHRDGTGPNPGFQANPNHGPAQGNGAFAHQTGSSRPDGGSWANERSRSGMSGNGGWARAESDRGPASMHQAGMGGMRGGGWHGGGGRSVGGRRR